MAPAAALVIRAREGQPFYEAKFRVEGRQIKRRVGPAWLDPDGAGGWRARHGRVREGFYDERRAYARAAELVDAFISEEAERARVEQERLARPVTFRELAGDYLRWLEHEYGAKPSTLRDHRYTLAEPGAAHARGSGATKGWIMAALGDRPARDITNDDIRELLATISASGVSARSVNKQRNLVAAIFNHGVKRGIKQFKLPSNPVTGIELRREPKPAPLTFFTPDEIEAGARALTDGVHRDQAAQLWVGEEERARRRAEDAQDGEAVRLAAYTGLRRGELIALRWRDIDWAGAKLTVSRAVSGDVESSPKSGQFRDVPLSDQAAAALERLSRRGDFTAADDLVLCNPWGRRIDPAALGRRYNRARDAIGLRPLRWHDLRHTFGSLLVAAGVDTVSVKAAMGHERITTTERYLHARPATQQAAAFTAAFAPKLAVAQQSAPA